jgi:hypothetical protein
MSSGMASLACSSGTAASRYRGSPREAYRRINSVEIALVVTIVFVAGFMARGAWLF